MDGDHNAAKNPEKPTKRQTSKRTVSGGENGEVVTTKKKKGSTKTKQNTKPEEEVNRNEVIIDNNGNEERIYGGADSRPDPKQLRISVLLRKGRPICEQGSDCKSEDPLHFMTYEHTERDRKENQLNQQASGRVRATSDKKARRISRLPEELNSDDEGSMRDRVKTGGRKNTIKKKKTKKGGSKREAVLADVVDRDKEREKTAGKKTKKKKKKSSTLSQLQGKVKKIVKTDDEGDKHAVKKYKSEGEEDSSEDEREQDENEKKELAKKGSTMKEGGSKRGEKETTEEQSKVGVDVIAGSVPIPVRPKDAATSNAFKSVRLFKTVSTRFP